VINVLIVNRSVNCD